MSLVQLVLLLVVCKLTRLKIMKAAKIARSSIGPYLENSRVTPHCFHLLRGNSKFKQICTLGACVGGTERP